MNKIQERAHFVRCGHRYPSLLVQIRANKFHEASQFWWNRIFLKDIINTNTANKYGFKTNLMKEQRAADAWCYVGKFKATSLSQSQVYLTHTSLLNKQGTRVKKPEAINSPPINPNILRWRLPVCRGCELYLNIYARQFMI